MPLSEPTLTSGLPAVSRLVSLGAVLALTACGAGFGLQKIDESLLITDSGSLNVGGDDGGGDNGGDTDTGLTGSGSGGSGSSGSGSSGSGSSGSGSSGSGSSGSGDSGSGSSGSGDSGSGSSGSGSSGSGSSGSGSSGSGSSGSGSSGSGSSGSGGPTDADGDGYDSTTDCNDSDASVHPGATEICDSRDNDCDGLIDADDSSLSGGSTGYRDADGDGYGNSSLTATICSEGSGYVFTPGDCDDTYSSVNPGAAEVCDDGLDNDCSGVVDDSPSCAMSMYGGFVLLYGYSQYTAGSYNCGLLWNVTGTEDTSVCPTCDFAFDVSAVYDSTAGFNDGSCSGMTSFTATWAYDSNYYGSTPYFLEYYGGSWYPVTSNVNYDASTGYWAWGAGVLDYPYSYWFSTYYYTYYQYMVAYTY